MRERPEWGSELGNEDGRFGKRSVRRDTFVNSLSFSMDGFFHATARFQDSGFFQKAITLLLRCILSVIYITLQDLNFNPVPPMFFCLLLLLIVMILVIVMMIMRS